MSRLVDAIIFYAYLKNENRRWRKFQTIVLLFGMYKKNTFLVTNLYSFDKLMLKYEE